MRVRTCRMSLFLMSDIIYGSAVWSVTLSIHICKETVVTQLCYDGFLTYVY